MAPRGSLAQRAENMLREQGILSARLVFVQPAGQDRISERAIFELDGLLLRFVRERTEEFLDIGTQTHADEFHQFDDVAIALGWTTVDAVLNKDALDPLDVVVSKLARRAAALRTELVGPQAEWTRARILRANADRAKALESRLR